MMGTRTRNVLISIGLLAVAFIPGCGVGVEPLMPTPILYTECGFAPLDHIPENERWVLRPVYYATDRQRNTNPQEISYTNNPSNEVSVGLALIGFGGPSMTWTDLERSSSQADRDEVVDLSIDGVIEAGRFPIIGPPSDAAGPDAAGWLLKDLNDAIADARDKDVLVYVHGAKVNFYNACAFAAQLDHFMGRDMTSVAYSWPTRQDIFAYVLGTDVKRAYDSGAALASLLEVLAQETTARRIHVLSWSAGARVATEALVVLRQRYPDETEETLRERFRLGTMYFAAGDIPTSEFLEALPTLHGIADRIVVTISSHDEALMTASVVMGEGGRIGQIAKLPDEEVQMIESFDRLEIIDVSYRSESRGFDITGHRYWFNHPWASSDVLLAIRTDLSPSERGLVQEGDSRVTWFMPDDYPQRLKVALETVELRRW